MEKRSRTDKKETLAADPHAHNTRERVGCGEERPYKDPESGREDESKTSVRVESRYPADAG